MHTSSRHTYTVDGTCSNVASYTAASSKDIERAERNATRDNGQSWAFDVLIHILVHTVCPVEARHGCVTYIALMKYTHSSRLGSR